MEVDGVDTAQVNGTYVARTAGAITPTSYDAGVVTVPDTSANFFKVNDTVTTASGTTTISKVSRDGVTITLASGTGAGDIALAAAEETGLIMGLNTATSTGVVDNLDTGATGFLAY
jgi:hypothetical protein